MNVKLSSIVAAVYLFVMRRWLNIKQERIRLHYILLQQHLVECLTSGSVASSSHQHTQIVLSCSKQLQILYTMYFHVTTRQQNQNK